MSATRDVEENKPKAISRMRRKGIDAKRDRQEYSKYEVSV